MLFVETEVNGNSKTTNERVGSLGSSCRYKRLLLSCLRCSEQPSTRYFFFAVHYFNLCVTITKQLGQAVVQGRLSLKVCLWLQHTRFLFYFSQLKFVKEIFMYFQDFPADFFLLEAPLLVYFFHTYHVVELPNKYPTTHTADSFIWAI